MSTQTGSVGKSVNVRKMVTMAMLCAIGVVLVGILRFPIIPAAPFLEYDPADIPILIGTLIYGPGAGVAMTVVVSLIQGFTVSASSGWIGIVMHVAATGAMVFVAGTIYTRGKKTLLNAAVSLTAGAAARVIVMIGMNLILTPIFMNVPVSVVRDMLVPAIIPFNVVKDGINSVIAFGLFRAVEKIAPEKKQAY